MFKDECILVDEEEHGHILYNAPCDGKWGENESYYLLFIIQDVALHPNLEEVVKYVSKDQLKELIRKERKVMIKLHRKLNKHRPFSKKEKMNDELSNRVL